MGGVSRRRRGERAHGAAGVRSHRRSGRGRTWGVEDLRGENGRDEQHEATAGWGVTGAHRFRVAASPWSVEPFEWEVVDA